MRDQRRVLIDNDGMRVVCRVALMACVAACSGASTRPTVAPPPPPARLPVPTPAVSPVPPVDLGAAPLPRWSRLRVGKLANGLTYYVLPNAKPAKNVRIWLAVNAGSVQEDDDQRGVAHLIEHMAFNGTKRFPKNDLVADLERTGMRVGADINASTSMDHTVYKLEVPIDDTDIDRALDILRDWAGDISFEMSELGAAGTANKERGVVIEEWRTKRGAMARLFDKQVGVLFDGTHYATRLPIGTPESIKNASPEAILRFYKDWYRPDLMAVIVVGDIKNPDTLEKAIRDRFSDLASPTRPRTHTSGGAPVAHGARISIETDPEAPGTSVEIASFATYRAETTRRDYRRVLAQRLYTRILRERLAALSRQSASAFTLASTSVTHIVADADMFMRRAHAKKGHAEEALRSLLAEVARIERYGVTQGELDRARAAMLRGYDITAERVSESSALCDEIARQFFDREEMSGPVVEQALTHEIVPTITAAELDDAIKAFAGADNRVVLISGADPSDLPSRDRVVAAIEDVGKTELAPWKDKPLPDTLMTTLPTPGTIVKETKIPSIDAVEWILSNGVKVVVKPTKFDADAVLLEGAAPGGEAMASDKDYPTARFANSIARSIGVGELDAGALRDVLTEKHLMLSTVIGETRQSISASGTARDLETMLQLVHLRMTAPREDADEIAAWRQRAAEAIADSWQVPDVKFGREVVDTLYNHNKRRAAPDAAAIAAVDPAKALSFYKARFADASGFTFAIVGSVNLDTLRPLVKTYLASLPATGKPDKERDLGIRKARGVVVKRWKHGTEPKALVEIEFHADQGWSRDAEEDMYVLGEVLRMQLRDVLREDLGGVYHVSVTAKLDRLPHPSRTVLVTFGCDPARVDEMVKATLGVAADLGTHGPSSDYLDRVRQQFTHTHETNIHLNQEWLTWMMTAYHYGDDPALFLDATEVVSRMTPQTVKAAAHRFLDPAQYFEGVLLPSDTK